MILDDNQKRHADAFIKRLEYYRSEDRHECALVGYRMNWLVTCQAFLIAAYVVIHGSHALAFRLGFDVLLPLIGVYVARSIHMSIAEGDTVIYFWHRKERAWYEEICELEDQVLRTYLLTFWGDRWPASSPRQISDEIHERSFHFQRNIHEKLIWAWVFIFQIGLVVDIYVACHLGALDRIFGVP